MSDEAATTWFYTHEGEKIGPVTFGYLQSKAKEGGINPRHDMAWTQGMPEWKHAGEIEGLFERASATAERESLAPSSVSHVSSNEESVEDRMAQEDDWQGARRRSFLFTLFVLPFLAAIAFTAGQPLLIEKLGVEIAGYITLAGPVLVILVAVYFGIQRLTNLGMSRWWYLGYLVPLLNIWVLYRSFACPAGYAFHKKMDGIGIFLAIVFWLVLLAGIAGIAAMVAALMGTIADPAIQEQIKEVLRQLEGISKTTPVP